MPRLLIEPRPYSLIRAQKREPLYFFLARRCIFSISLRVLLVCWIPSPFHLTHEQSKHHHPSMPHPFWPVMNPSDNTGHHYDSKTGHQICNAVTWSTMAAPFARSPSRSTRGTTVEISAAVESHRHRNRGRATALSLDLIEPEDPNREPQSRI